MFSASVCLLFACPQTHVRNVVRHLQQAKLQQVKVNTMYCIISVFFANLTFTVVLKTDLKWCDYMLTSAHRSNVLYSLTVVPSDYIICSTDVFTSHVFCLIVSTELRRVT